MKRIVSVILFISICLVLFGVNFDAEVYINNLTRIIDNQPSFPNLNIDWSKFSITNWKPLGQFFNALWLLIRYPIDLLLWVFDLCFNLFGIQSNISNIGFDGEKGFCVPNGQGGFTCSSSNAGGGHGGSAG